MYPTLDRLECLPNRTYVLLEALFLIIHLTIPFGVEKCLERSIDLFLLTSQ